jgi:hypothetical protein
VTDVTRRVCGPALPAGPARRSLGGDTGNQRKAVTMRPVRILLVVLALAAVGLAGWALGARDTYRPPAAVAPATTRAPAQATTPSPARDVPRPRIFGFGSEPVYPQKGGVWQLPAGPGEAVLITDARHATKVEFLLTPAGTGTAGEAVTIGVDTDGRDAYVAHWRYGDQPLLAHLTVRATGPGGLAEHTVGIYHSDPGQAP